MNLELFYGWFRLTFIIVIRLYYIKSSLIWTIYFVGKVSCELNVFFVCLNKITHSRAKI